MVIVYSVLVVAGILAALSAFRDYREKKREQEFRTKFDERWSKYFEGGNHD